MWNRRKLLVSFTAAGLVMVSLAAAFLPSSNSQPISPDGWQITLLKNGQPFRNAHFEQMPHELNALLPTAADGETYSILIEPAALNRTELPSWISTKPLSTVDRPVVEFLLLLPPATLLICLFRNVVGLGSFGTFAPALLGLAFREVQSLLGVFVVLSIISAGWWLRRGLNELHLLQVPRTALLLSCVVVLLLVLLFALSGSGPRAITLFPLVILTGMIERFWSMEEEDGTTSSLTTLATTLALAGCVWALATIPAVPIWMMRHPETLGLIMAGQLLLGRYTGFRLMEIYRFRALARI